MNFEELIKDSTIVTIEPNASFYKESNFDELKKRPHVVILGAGASIATIPNGDKFGKKICAMEGFIKKAGLSHILEGVNLETTSENLENIYMELDKRSKDNQNYQEVKNNLEDGIRQFIEKFCLPDTATIYDYLILSLSKKDLIATFNWDPLLVQAVRRVSKFTQNTPKVVFLHGNVASGFCSKCNFLGNKGIKCPKCGSQLKDVPLLYPVKEKNYRESDAISAAWDCLEQYLSQAFMITIFGYSAPISDNAAIDLMKKAWGNNESRKLEEIEIVDIRPEDSVLSSWKDFIFSHHYSYFNSFFNTSLAKFPRRSCEAMVDQLFFCEFLNDTKGFKDLSIPLDKAYAHIKELDEEESNGITFSNPYIN